MEILGGIFFEGRGNGEQGGGWLGGGGTGIGGGWEEEGSGNRERGGSSKCSALPIISLSHIFNNRNSMFLTSLAIHYFPVPRSLIPVPCSPFLPIHSSPFPVPRSPFSIPCSPIFSSTTLATYLFSSYLFHPNPTAMKKVALTLIIVCLTGFLVPVKAQVVITEIMYNDPSAGAQGDTLEFIELTNNSGVNIDLTGYSFTMGIIFTFPSTILPPHDHLVIAKNVTAVNNFFGITGTFQWDAGQTLSNNGEAIVLKNAGSATVDSVRYYTAAPWPTVAGGLGASLMLCDPDLDNNTGSNWVGSYAMNASSFGLVNGIYVYATPLSGCITLPPYLPAYAALPFLETFDSAWLNGNNLRDIPGYNWKNSPNTGNNSWRRSDDGTAAAWTTPATGAYSPTGALSTGNSARFHSASASAGLQGTLDLYLDLSIPGLKKLSFWYINSSGSDSLALWISYDAGSSFTFLQKFQTTSGGWNEKIVYLGISTSNEVIVRFRATSNSSGSSDIGIDQVSVEVASSDDAGISDITQPSSVIFSTGGTVKVNLTNFGNNNLTSADIIYSINNSIPLLHPWTGNLTPMETAANINLGPCSFLTTGINTLKAWTSSPNGYPDTDPSNDTLVKYIIFQNFASLPFTENFENQWIDKFGTHDAPSLWWINNPDTGSNSWRRNEDGASAGWTSPTVGDYDPAGALSSGFSARFHTAGNPVLSQGTLDLYIDFNIPGQKELRFYYINTAGTDSLTVWMSTDGGQTFNFLSKYTISSTWELKTLGLGSSTSPHTILRFRATSNNGGTSDIGLDEISIGQPIPDVSVLSIINPQTSCNLTNHEDLIFQIKNNGNIPVSQIPFHFVLDGNPVSAVINQTLLPGETISYTLLQQLDLSAFGIHSLTVFSTYPGDDYPDNDTVKISITHIQAIMSFPFMEDFGNGNTWYFALSNGVNAGIQVEPGIGNLNSYGLRMTGKVAGSWPAGSGNSTTANQAWETYTDHHSFAITCYVDALTLSHPQVLLDLRQIYIASGGPKYSWFRLMVNDTIPVPNQYGMTDFNPLSQNADPFLTQVFDLSAFANTYFKLSLQSSCKYDEANASGGNGDNVFIDNLIIRDKPPVDLAITSISSPTSNCGLTNQETVTITLKNLGSAAASQIPVSYSQDNGITWVSEVIDATLAPDNQLTYTFTQLADLSGIGTYSLKAVVSQSGDADHRSDTLSSIVKNVPFISMNANYTEDFENGSGGWTSEMISNADEWVLGMPAKTYLNTAHSGTTAWFTGITYNYSLNSNSYIVSPCFDFLHVVNPILSVWLNLKTENNFDAMIMEVSVNDSTWYKIIADEGFYNNASTQGPVTPPKWSGNSNGWQRDTTSLPGLAGKAKVRFRFRFESDNSIVDEGIAIDDISISDYRKDLSVTSLLNPVSGPGLSPSESVTVKIKNLGTLSCSDIPVGIISDNSVINEVIPGTLNPGDSISYTFASKLNMGTEGNYNLRIFTALTDDVDKNNDTLFATVTHSAVTLYEKAFAYCGWANYGSFPVGPMVFPIDDPLQAVSLDDQSTSDYLCGGTWANDHWYASTEGYNSSPQLLTIDTLTGDRTTIAYLSTSIQGLAYDWTTQNLYGISYNGSYSDLQLIDPVTGAMTTVGSCGSIYGITLACDKYGNLFTIDIYSDQFGSVNKLTGAFTPIGYIGFDANYEQDMSFENATNTLYYAAFNNSTYRGEWRTIDPQTGMSTLIAPFPGGMWVTALAIRNNPPVLPASDLGMKAIAGPISGPNLTDNEHLTVSIKNFGTQPQQNFTVSYTVDNGPVVSHIIPDTLQPGMILTFTFPQEIDLTLHGHSYLVKIFTSLPGDENNGNDTLTITITNTYGQYCEAGSLNCLNYITAVYLAYMENYSGCETGGYADYSNFPVDVYYNDSYNIDIDGDNSQYYYGKCGVWIDWNHNGDFTDETPVYIEASGNYFFGYFTVPNDVAPGPARMRIRMVQDWESLSPCGISDYGEVEDYILNVVGTPVYDDLKLSAIQGVASGFNLGNAYPVSVQLINMGLTPKSGFYIDLLVDGNPVSSELFTDTLQFLETAIFTFTQLIDLSLLGIHTVEANIVLPGDEDLSNNNLNIEIKNYSSGEKVYAYCASPMYSSTPAGPVIFAKSDPQVMVSLADQSDQAFIAAATWANGQWYGTCEGSNGSKLFTIDTLTGERTFIADLGFGITGLSFDITSGFLYAISYDNGSSYLNLIDPYTGALTVIGQCSPSVCINLACDIYGNLYTVDFNSDQLGSVNKANGGFTDIGYIGFDAYWAQDMEFDFSTNTLYYAAFNYPYNRGEWRTVDTETGYASLIETFPGDMEVTGLAFNNNPLNLFANDLSPREVITPVSGWNLTDDEHLTIKIKNFGTQPQQNFTVSYTVDNGPVVAHIIPDTLQQGMILTFTFPQEIDLSLHGHSYLVKIFTSLPGDENSGNDTLTVTITNTYGQYCEAGSVDCEPYITHLQFAGINNSSDCSPGGYA
ncbi:MAG: lamin tail domain-containing protein, partial [Bacteroidetes bacterium]|nr:lamin tail domain-containing protein [Bacteroidota bacterium]